MSTLVKAGTAGALAAAALLVGGIGDAAAQSIVERIKQRGYVSCGASQGVPGLSRPDEQGVWRGFDSDIIAVPPKGYSLAA